MTHSNYSSQDIPDVQEAQPAPDRSTRLRLAAVINWRDLGRWIWSYLPETEYQADLIVAAPEHKPGRAKRLPAYLREFWYLSRRRPDFDRYDVVFAWELRAALAVALWRRLTRQHRARLVVISPIFKGRILRALPLIRPLMADFDRFVCFSSTECTDYARLLRLPPERFVFHPAVWRADEPQDVHDGGYILSLGQSNRDYPTLVEAARGTDLPVTIVSGNPKWLNGQEPPPNVSLRFNTPFHETNALLAGATFHVVPLADSNFSAGQSALLRAMVCGKALIVTDTQGVRDYVRDGETVMLVPPADAEAMRAAMLLLWNDPAERERLGRNAARAVREEFSFSRMAQSLAALAKELVAGDEGREVQS